MTRQHIAAGGAIKGPPHHELGLQVEGASLAHLQWLEVVPEIEAVAVFRVHRHHPAVFHLAILLKALIALQRDRQAVFQDQLVALGLNHQVAVGLLIRHHAASIHPRLRRCVGVVGEGNAIGLPALGGHRELIGLHAPAADHAAHKLAVFLIGEWLQLPGPHVAVGHLPASDGHIVCVAAGLPLHLEALLELQATHALIHRSRDRFAPQCFLLPGAEVA